MIVCCVCLSFISGCATILSHGDKAISIISNPEGANVVVKDSRTYTTVSKNKAPCQVILERGDGWFLKKYYNLYLSKEGYISEQVEVTPTFNPLYICNIFFGGPIGMITVDALTGDMWQYYVDKIYVKLYPETPEGHVARAKAIREKLAKGDYSVDADKQYKAIKSTTSPDKSQPMPVKQAEPSVNADQQYNTIKGIVLINGNVIEGQIISMNPDIVKIRTKDGKVLSYDFKYEVQKFITE